jgi:hypothetical protein
MVVTGGSFKIVAVSIAVPSLLVVCLFPGPSRPTLPAELPGLVLLFVALFVFIGGTFKDGSE